MKKSPVLFLLAFFTLTSLAAAEKPNILWIFAEDTSPWMGCYGYTANAGQTPNIDSIAAAGVRFDRAYVPAPVCSACRSAMMGGQSQIRFGAHEHRSSRAKDAQLQLPEGMKLLPQIMQENGYFTFNHGKTDYNFVWDQDATYSKAQLKGKTDSWDILKENQPFFGQIQTKGGKNSTKKFPKDRQTDPATVTVPPDYPQNDLYREIVAQHCDAIRTDDDLIGEILKGLKESGMAENTVVVYFSDHGANHLVRHKQMPTEGGLHVPFVVMGPENLVPKQGVRDDLVNMLDLSATTLAWAGVEQPAWYEGQDLFAKGFKPRDAVFSGKDRLDHTLDRVRTVRTDSFRYTRNFKLDRILLQPQYRDGQAYTKNLHELYASGELSPKLTEIFFGERQEEELYDVSKDPHQLQNLAKDPAYADELKRHRKLLDDWLAKGDKGEGEESVAAMKYNADQWQGGRGVNPEYEVYRTDSDGDGLSDKWEKINKRDPEDGRLHYEFDCGGWQTEGWTAVGTDDNIAGFLGHLDFALNGPEATLVREDIKAKTTSKDVALLLKLRSSGKLSITALANGNPLDAPTVIKGGDAYTEVRFPIAANKAWSGNIGSLQFKLNGNKGDVIEVDSIAVERVGS